jgi:hypothetical protein
MSDFLGDYGFFILIALLMIGCHLGHAGHGAQRRRDGDGRGEHRH